MVMADPVTFDIDSRHTYPSFAADHQSGFSIWRGKIRETSGTIVIDREAQSGTVEVSMNMASIDFGIEAMNDHARAPDIFDVEQFPTATYTGTLTGFQDGAPTAVTGNLTMHGKTKLVSIPFKVAKGKNGAGVDTTTYKAKLTIDRNDYGIGTDSIAAKISLEDEVELKLLVVTFQ